MIESALFVDGARGRGFGLWTGVPCSYLTSFLNEVISDVFPRTCRDPRSHLPR